MVHFFYDGSLNGDWVFRYALRFAGGWSVPRLRVVHVLDQKISADRLSEKIEYMKEAARSAGVETFFEIIPRDRRGIAHSLRAEFYRYLPSAHEESAGSPGEHEETEELIICGARGRGKRKGYLRGTVSQQILNQDWRAHIMVIRVVQPGLLGQASDILVPLSRHKMALERTLRFIGYLQKPLSRVHLLHVTDRAKTSGSPWHWNSEQKSDAEKQRAQGFTRDVAQVVRRFLDGENARVDWRVVAALNPLREILVQASHLRAEAILMGAPRVTTAGSGLVNRIAGGGRYGRELEEFLRQSGCDVIFYQEHG